MTESKQIAIGNTERPDLEVLDKILYALRDLTQTKVSLNDILEWEE